MEEETQAIIIRLPKELHKKIRLLAVLQDTSVNKIVNQLLEEYVNKHEKEGGTIG